MATQRATLLAVIDYLVDQGCHTRDTRGGVFILCPDGETTIGIHLSKASDMRTLRNVKAAVRKAGLKWPGDK